MSGKKLLGIVSVAALVTVLSVLAVTAAFAQSATPPAQSTPSTPSTPGKAPWGGDRGFGFFGGDSIAVFDAQAKALNLTPTQLFEQLHSGKTLSEVAQAQGVDLQTVQDAARAAQTQAMKDNIAQAVKDGRITQAQADWMLQGLENGWMGGHGFGGRGMGHRGMFGPMNGQAPAAPTASPTTGTQG